MTKLNILQKQMIERNLQPAYETSVRSHRRILRRQDPTWGILPTPKELAKANWVLARKDQIEMSTRSLWG